MKRLVMFVIVGLIMGLAACGGNAPAPTAAPANPPTAVSGNAAAPTNPPAPTTASQPTAAPAQPTQAVEPTQAVAPTAAPVSGDVKPPEGAPLDVVKKAMLNVFTANSVRATTILQSANGESQTLLLEFVKPDRMRIVQPDGGEQIAVKGKGVWRKVGDKWENQGAQMADMLFGLFEASAVEESLQAIQVDSVQFVGPDLVDGKPMFVYTYKTTVDMGGTKNLGTGKIWLGALDGRVYKGESDSESLAMPGKTDHTIVTYEYDIPLDIQAPE